MNILFIRLFIEMPIYFIIIVFYLIDYAAVNSAADISMQLNVTQSDG